MGDRSVLNDAGRHENNTKCVNCFIIKFRQHDAKLIYIPFYYYLNDWDNKELNIFNKVIKTKTQASILVVDCSGN